jgi:hypothetical protein
MNRHRDARAIANEFLDLWERAHDIPDGAKPDYDRLKSKLAIFAGETDVNFDALRRELYEGRKARGWPDPKPGTIQPSIEGAIISLWIAGLGDCRPARREA